MHAPSVRARALELISAGLNDCQVAREMGIPRGTIRDWRRPRYQRMRPVATCPRCWRPAKAMWFSHEDYAELLGLYLGDGCISEDRRTMRLRIVLDAKYPRIIDDARDLLERCFPNNVVHVGKGTSGNCRSVSVYSSHLVCLLPQHGAGRKHARQIILEPWQQDVVDLAPWAFLRGCIRSDGCVFINRTGPYEYLSYDFTNSSDEITHLFVSVCEDLGLRPRANRDTRDVWHVRINRHDSVVRMVEHVGLKS